MKQLFGALALGLAVVSSAHAIETSQCVEIAKLYRTVATARDAGVPLSATLAVAEETWSRTDRQGDAVKQMVTAVYTAEVKAPPAEIEKLALQMCLKDTAL
jgi:hypothetical protein